MANSIDRVKQSIRERLEELETERDQLLRALEALNTGGAAPVGRRRGRPPGAGRVDKRAAGRRAPRGQRRQQVIDVLSGGEMGPSEIARQIGDVNPTQISGLLRQLSSEGVVTRTAGGKWTVARGAGGAGEAASGGNGGEGSPAVEQAPAESVAG